MSLTDTQLLDLTVGQRQSTWRFDLVNAGGSVIGKVSPLGDGRVAIENNINRAVKRTMRGLVLGPADMAAIDLLNDHVRVVMILQNGSEYGCGEFRFADRPRAVHSWGDTGDAILCDLLWQIDQPIPATLSLAAGTALMDALGDRYAFHGITRYAIDSTDYTLRAPLVWPAGTSGLKVMNHLSRLGGYFSVYFDNTGLARSRLVGTASTPDLTYEGGPTSRIIADSILLTDDELDAPNLYLVVDSAIGQVGFVGRYEVPESAPYSYAKRGFYVANPPVYVSGLTSQDQADAAAVAVAAHDVGFAWASFSSPPDPRHDTFDMIQLLGQLYREHSWSMTLAEGTRMDHKLRRVWT